MAKWVKFRLSDLPKSPKSGKPCLIGVLSTPELRLPDRYRYFWFPYKIVDDGENIIIPKDRYDDIISIGRESGYKVREPKQLENLTEATRSELIGKARSDDKQRYNNRLGYRPVTFDGVNIRELFTNDDLVFTTKVGSYTDTIAVKGMLTELKNAVKGKQKCTYADTLKALNNCLNADGLRMLCGCADFTYRYKYWAYAGGYLYGDPGKAAEPPKFDRTNKDGRGSMCKHLASLLTNKIWIVKVAAAVNNYIRLHKEECYPYLDLEIPEKKPTDEPQDQVPEEEPTDTATPDSTDLEPEVDEVPPNDDTSDEFDDEGSGVADSEDGTEDEV